MKITITAILIFLVTLTFGQTKNKYGKIIDSLNQAGQAEKILPYLEKELKQKPKNEDLLRELGYQYIETNRLDLGEKYYTAALSVNPKCALCYMNIGRIYALKNNFKKALEYISKAINIDPNDAIFYSFRGKLKEILGDKSAIIDHNRAIELAPTNANCYVERGIFNSNKGYSLLALSDFSKAIELSPKNYLPYFRRASIYFEEQNFNEALKDINKAIELDSTQFSLYTGRGAIFDIKKDYEKAVVDYSKAISISRTDFLPYVNRASSYYKLENLDAACSDYLILKSFIDKGKISEQSVITEVKNSIQGICDSNKASYYYQRGIAFYNLKEYQKAVNIYSTGLSKFTEEAMTLSFQGNAYLALAEYKKALECYYLSIKNKEKILKEIKQSPRFYNLANNDISGFYNGSLASIHFSIAECKVYLNSFDEALFEINKALELAPDIKGFEVHTYFNMRGFILLMKGQYKQAIEDFDKSIQLNKNFPFAYVNRAIAKINLTEKVKSSSFVISGQLNNQPISITWTLPDKPVVKKPEVNIQSALSDCNKAIEIEKNNGFAYYIRGQIKKILSQGDYCLDLLNAKQLGLTVEAELLKECIK